jgi:hypothetical protein
MQRLRAHVNNSKQTERRALTEIKAVCSLGESHPNKGLLAIILHSNHKISR